MKTNIVNQIIVLGTIVTMILVAFIVRLTSVAISGTLTLALIGLFVILFKYFKRKEKEERIALLKTSYIYLFLTTIVFLVNEAIQLFITINRVTITELSPSIYFVIPKIVILVSFILFIVFMKKKTHKGIVLVNFMAIIYGVRVISVFYTRAKLDSMFFYDFPSASASRMTLTFMGVLYIGVALLGIYNLLHKGKETALIEQKDENLATN